MSANVVFINIDWKQSRHNKEHANMSKLSFTIGSVINNMKPAMLCMSEVGEASIALTEMSMQQVANQTVQAWRDAATEHVELKCMFEVGAPYMTVYDVSQVQCSCHRILTDLFSAQGQPRTAQAFLCCGPGGVTVDVTNVHLPSGGHKLTNQQRKTFLKNVLQSKSKSMPGTTIGHARFLIGGDMNTLPFALSGMLQTCKDDRVLHTAVQVIHPTFAKHGDVCFLGGFTATCLTTRAENHDHQHIPYGICWIDQRLYASRSATEQPLPPLPAKKPQRAISSSLAASSSQNAGYVTEQLLPTPPPTAPMAVPPMPTRSPPMPAPSMLARLLPMSAPATFASNLSPSPTGYATEQPSSVGAEIDDLHRRAEQGAISEKDVMQELETLHTKHGNVLQPEDYERISDEKTVAAATEHSEKSAEPQKEYATMICSIVNEFLCRMTYNNPEAEQLLQTAVENESALTQSILQRIEEVFSPIFFHYPNGLRDRFVWVPRDTSEYIRQWREVATWRARIGINDNADTNAAAEHGEQLSKDQVTRIFGLYLEDFKTSLRPDQLDKKWTYYKSCAESKLNRDCGSRFVANAIWQIGLPRMPSFATEQQSKKLSKEALEDVPQAIHNVLTWLALLADTLSNHKATTEYATALRKSGDTHGQSGLTATELETQAAIRKTRLELQNAKKLHRQWENKELTNQNWRSWQETLLLTYWDGSLQRRLEEMIRESNADPMCRTPTVRSKR
jgi:hypothetical protein